jgi:anthranilate synthase component II
MVLLIDNFDSFSHILADYLVQAGLTIHIVRNDVSLEEIKKGNWEGLVLSPGPQIPKKAGNLLQILDFYHDKLPLLGICLGHQAIGEYFGGKLVKSERPVHGKVHQVFKIGEHPMLESIPENFYVTRYHSLEIRDLPADFEVLLQTERKEIMAIAHRNLPIVGIQYHPEAYLSEFGLEIIRNWSEFYIKGQFSHRICF